MAGASWPRRRIAGGVLAMLNYCRKIRGCRLECRPTQGKRCDVLTVVWRRSDFKEMEVGRSSFYFAGE